MAHVLLVEDHELVNKFLCAGIHVAGHTADCVTTKYEAEQVLGPGSHDAVVCDLMLPDGPGYDVLRKAEQLGIPTVAMTGHPDEMEALSASNMAHIRKPFDLPELIELIESSIALH